MQKVTFALLVLVSVATAGSHSRFSPRLKRQIFDSVIDFNSGIKSARIPARKNSLEPRSGKGIADGYKYISPTTDAQTYLPPTSTPGPKYLTPSTTTTIRTTTVYRPPVTYSPYTGTYPTYKSSSYVPYIYTGTYPPIPSTMRPLTTTTTKRPVIGYEYTKPALNAFSVEDVYKRGR